jgi:hypothetical protein
VKILELTKSTYGTISGFLCATVMLEDMIHSAVQRPAL